MTLEQGDLYFCHDERGTHRVLIVAVEKWFSATHAEAVDVERRRPPSKPRRLEGIQEELILCVFETSREVFFPRISTMAEIPRNRAIDGSGDFLLLADPLEYIDPR